MDGINPFDCNRRDFLKTTGIGVAALSLAGAGWIYNSKPASAAAMSKEQIDTNVLAIGGGLAATIAALKAKEQGLDVTLVDKGRVGKSGLSPFGSTISAFDPKGGDSKEETIREVSKAEEYLTNPAYTKLRIDHSKSICDEMVAFGMFEPVDNNRDPACRKELIKKKSNSSKER